MVQVNTEHSTKTITAFRCQWYPWTIFDIALGKPILKGGMCAFRYFQLPSSFFNQVWVPFDNPEPRANSATIRDTGNFGTVMMKADAQRAKLSISE